VELPPDVDPTAQIRLPAYWTRITTSSFARGDADHVTAEAAYEAPSERSQVPQSFIEDIQDLMDETWKGLTTRDRAQAKVSKLKVVHVLRNENAALWASYYVRRESIREECQARGEAFGQISTKTSGAKACRGLMEQSDLYSGANEFYLFHGTNPSSAHKICFNHFRVDRAGTHKGTLYGAGIYFAEACSKADEYAQDDMDGLYQGLFAMLLCRVVCGDLLHTADVKPNVKDLVNDVVDEKKHHSVLGDREKARNTYREFIVYDNNQAYPEYIIIYRRVLDEVLG